LTRFYQFKYLTVHPRRTIHLDVSMCVPTLARMSLYAAIAPLRHAVARARFIASHAWRIATRSTLSTDRKKQNGRPSSKHSTSAAHAPASSDHVAAR
jgi:hypothetical protein